MTKLAYIERAGRRTHVVLPIAEWERLQERLENRADIAAAAPILADPAEYRLPLEVVERIADGIHPVRALREWRGLSQAALAEAAGVAQPTVARIEVHHPRRVGADLEPPRQGAGRPGRGVDGLRSSRSPVPGCVAGNACRSTAARQDDGVPDAVPDQEACDKARTGRRRSGVLAPQAAARSQDRLTSPRG